VAQAGGTARATSPYYYRVDTSDVATLDATLGQVAASILSSCAMTLADAVPDGGTLSVQQAGASVPADSSNGWTAAGTSLTLHGSACQQWQASGGTDVTVTETSCGPG
jgi:hypothetical protein